jgi:hypothetical protein
MRLDAAGRLNINTTTATSSLARTKIVASDTDSTSLHVTHINSSGGLATNWGIKVDGNQPNNTTQYYGIQVSPLQSYLSSMTGIDVTYSAVYGVSYGLNVNLSKSLDATTNGTGIYSNVISTGTTNSGTLLAGDFKISQTGGASTDQQNVARFHNASVAGNSKFLTFGTEATFTERGSITYNRSGGLTVYNTTSDYRAKNISGPVTNSGTLIDSVPVYMGKIKWAEQERPMFIAHETPEYAHTGVKDAVDADGNPVYQQMDASALIPVMWAEIQSLRIRIAQLEAK